MVEKPDLYDVEYVREDLKAMATIYFVQLKSVLVDGQSHRIDVDQNRMHEVEAFDFVVD